MALSERAISIQYPSPQLSADLPDPPAGPDHPADDLDRGGIAIGPARISGTVAPDGERPRRRVEREPLDHQRLFPPEHVNSVADPLGAVAAVDQDVVAMAERRRHRIALDPDDRELIGGAARDLPEPGGIEGDIGLAALASVIRPRARRRADVEAGDRPQGPPPRGRRSEEHTAETTP